MGESLLFRSMRETLPEMWVVLAGWGGGLIALAVYCLSVWVLFALFGKYVMALGVVLLLLLFFFFVNWSYRYQYEKKLQSMKQEMDDLEEALLRR